LEQELARSNISYRNPRLYDELQADNAATALCTALIEAYGPSGAQTVLDLGCGTGQALGHLARRFTYVGIDVQPLLIDYGRQVRPTLDLQVGDLRETRLGRSVDAIICVGNVLAYLHTTADLTSAFATFAAHAHPGTVLILGTLVAASPAALHSAAPVTQRVDTATAHASVTVRHEWNLHHQIETTYRHWRFDDGTEAEDCIRRRVVFPRELELYLNTAGFDLLEIIPDGHGGEVTGPGAYIVARSTRHRGNTVQSSSGSVG